MFVKDESSRLGLPAFKVLGASWAVHQLLTAPRAVNRPPRLAPLPRRSRRAAHWRPRRPGLIFVTATDGNHGRAVARMARLTGAPARVFVPAVTEPATRAAIASEGAEVIQVAGSYDEAVAAARQWAADHPGAALVQDTAWPGYEQVPGLDRRGLLHPVRGTRCPARRRRRRAAWRWLRCPVGVGSLAQAAVAHYRGTVTAEGWLGRGQNSAPRQPSSVTAVLSVEPDTAACLLASLRAGRPMTVPTANTIMAGLNCGTISSIAWPYFSGGLDAAVAVTDDAARRAAADLAAAGISSGPERRGIPGRRPRRADRPRQHRPPCGARRGLQPR